MSWSISATGMPEAVAAAIADQASKFKCPEPEQTILQSAVEIIAVACKSMPKDQAVAASASGAQTCKDAGNGECNQLAMSIEPLWGFVV